MSFSKAACGGRAMILVDTHPFYRQITLNRPERLNALHVEMADAIVAALDEAQADASCRAILLTGAGRGFCAGQDVTAIADADPDDIADLLEHYHPVIEKVRELRLPVVAAVNGVAAGAGCNLALACDIVIASRSASFVQAFARIGLVPDCGGTWFLPRLVGMARARALMMLAEPLPAVTAAEWGMIWRVVDDDRLMDEAHALASRLAAGPTVALGLIKQALDESGGNDLADQLDLESDLQLGAAETADHREGVRAFLAKRPPVFTGRRD
jgi:2-(1,2-epoxy-1,2-dihydrophenyl)acetyl-CoA isomerase